MYRSDRERKLTLDSLVRHDIDREIPRTPKEIYELNRMMAGKMRETFGENVIVVPSIGKQPV